MTKVLKTNDEYDKVLEIISLKVKKLTEKSDIELFFRAFLTPSEILELCDRYLIVKELLTEKPQREISQSLGVSISKITAGSRELKFNYGKDIFKKFINL